MKKVLAIVLCLVLFLSGCGVSPDLQTSPDREMTTLDLTSDMTGEQTIRSIVIENEEFDLVTKYSTSYNVAEWKITDGKTLKIHAWTTERNPDIEVYIEHVHIDLFLQAGFIRTEEMSNPTWQKFVNKASQLNGICQDSMDDTFHYSLQPGFSLNNGHHYENTFSIEGFSKDIIEGWGTYVGYYYGGGTGTINIEQARLTEQNLIKDGVYGNKMIVIYDLAIRNKGEEDFHTASVEDELFIPLYQG